MELFGPIKAFLAIALIRVGPSVGDSIVGDLSTVSESFGQPKVNSDFTDSKSLHFTFITLGPFNGTAAAFTLDISLDSYCLIVLSGFYSASLSLSRSRAGSDSAVGRIENEHLNASARTSLNKYSP